jgi:hypothetical protein
MRYLRALVLLASLLLPGASAVASVLTIADYQGFHDPDLKMLSIGYDLYALITKSTCGAFAGLPDRVGF